MLSFARLTALLFVTVTAAAQPVFNSVRGGVATGHARLPVQSTSARVPVAQTLPDEAAIRAVLDRQAMDWSNRQLENYEKGYKNSPDITFIGSSVRHGYAEMQAAYAKGYGTSETMGVLTFSGLEIRLLDAHFATGIGRFHLERTATGGGNADGIFSLVFEKTADGWKIILDHTSPTPPPAPPSTR